MTAEVPPVSLDIHIDTSRFSDAMRRMSIAIAGMPPAWRAMITAAAAFEAAERALAMTLGKIPPPRVRTGTLYPVTRAPYAHRARWAGRRPRR